MPTSSTGERGFTLIEVLAVVVVIAVLATMTVPRLYGGMGQRRLNAAAARFLTSAHYARDFATTHRRACRLTMDPEKSRYGLLAQRSPHRRPNEFGALRMGIGRPEDLGGGIRFGRIRVEPRSRRSGVTQQRDCITFDPMGRADAAVVEITDGRRVVSILVPPHTARARLVHGPFHKLPNDRRDLDDE